MGTISAPTRATYFGEKVTMSMARKLPRQSVSSDRCGIDQLSRRLAAQHGRSRLNRGSRRRKKIFAAPRARRINTIVIDDLFGRLGRRSAGRDLAIPTDGVKRSPRAEVENRDVPIDVQRKHRFSEE